MLEAEKLPAGISDLHAALQRSTNGTALIPTPENGTTPTPMWLQRNNEHTQGTTSLNLECPKKPQNSNPCLADVDADGLTHGCEGKSKDWRVSNCWRASSTTARCSGLKHRSFEPKRGANTADNLAGLVALSDLKVDGFGKNPQLQHSKNMQTPAPFCLACSAAVRVSKMQFLLPGTSASCSRRERSS